MKLAIYIKSRFLFSLLIIYSKIKIKEELLINCHQATDDHNLEDCDEVKDAYEPNTKYIQFKVKKLKESLDYMDSINIKVCSLEKKLNF